MEDVEFTFANIAALEDAIGRKSKASLMVGIKESVDWYKPYC
jgi:nucleoside-diphosphate-sugar epimerase